MERLERFVKAQDNSYTTALREVKSGHKKGHWIWYIFPQMKGLGYRGGKRLFKSPGIGCSNKGDNSSFIRPT